MPSALQRFRRKIKSYWHVPFFGVSVSAGGLTFVLGTVIIGLAAIDADANLLLILFGLCLGGILMSLCTGWYGLRRLQVERIAPPMVVQDVPFEIRYTISNPRLWGSARSVHLIDMVERGSTVDLLAPEAFFPCIRPGQTIMVNVTTIARRRGRLNLQAVRVKSKFPFGVFQKFITLPDKAETIVLPALCYLKQPIVQGRLGLRSNDWGQGSNAAPRIRGDEEYYGIREYRHGDNPKRIHWRRSARTGQLMIREMTKLRDERLWCVVDTRIERGNPKQSDQLELMISAAATLICEGLEQRAKVGLICSGGPLVVLPPGGSRAYRPRLLRELAIRTPNHEDLLAPYLERLAWPSRWRGPCVVFSTRRSTDVLEACALLGKRSGITTMFITGTPQFDSFFAHANEQFQKELHGSRSRVRRHFARGGRA